MKAQEIEILLNKYLDAETSLNEEAILRDYFNNNNVEPHLMVYKSMFAYFGSKDKYEKQVLKPVRSRAWISIAASIVLMIGSYFGYQAKERHDVRVAYNQTESAFNLLANNLNKGTEGMAYINEFDKATNKIFKE